MKKVIYIIFILILALSVSKAPKAAYAQGFGQSWDSSFQVMNLSTTDPANIDMYYYNPDGSLATMATGYTNPDHDSVLVGYSNEYFPVHATDGFNGSVMVTSDQPIVVNSNLIVNTPQKGLGSYVAFPTGANKIYFPLVMRQNSNNTSTFNVQNTGATSADITIHFEPQAGSSFSTVSDVTDTINAGAAHTYDLSSLSVFSAIGRWIGSATVTVADLANDSVAGVATTVSQKYANAYQLGTYNAFIAGSTTVNAPIIQENNSGNRTTINCQNISTSTTADITATYIPGPGSAAKSPETLSDIGPGGMAIFYQAYTGAVKFLGSAIVTSSPSVPMVCVINQQKPAFGRTSSYEGFNPASVTGKVVLPLIQSRNGTPSTGWVYTTINVATADGNPHDFTCDYIPSPGFSDPPSVSASGVAAYNFFQIDVYGNGNKFKGGAVCTVTDGSGAGIFAIVNHQRQSVPIDPRDTLSSYDGFNQ